MTLRSELVRALTPQTGFSAGGKDFPCDDALVASKTVIVVCDGELAQGPFCVRCLLPARVTC